MGVRGHLKFIWDSFVNNLKKEWQYKSSFFAQIVMMIFNNLFFIIQWVIIFNIIDDIGGYQYNDCLMLFGISAGTYGFAHIFFGGLWKVKDYIYENGLDVFLTQPKNVLINVACSSCGISAIGDFLYGFLILLIVKATWWWYFAYIGISIIGGLLYASVFTVYVSLCFVIKKGDGIANCITSIITMVNSYPPFIFNLFTKGLFLTVMPSLFCVFLPLQYIIYSFNIWWIIIYLAVVLLWILLAFFAFHRGIKHYNSGTTLSGRL